MQLNTDKNKPKTRTFRTQKKKKKKRKECTEQKTSYLAVMPKGLLLLLVHREQHLGRKPTLTKEIPTKDTDNWPAAILRIKAWNGSKNDTI